MHDTLQGTPPFPYISHSTGTQQIPNDQILRASQRTADCSAVSRQSWLTLSLHYTTNASLECCLDGHPATLLPFLSDSVVRNDIAVIGELFVADGAIRRAGQSLGSDVSAPLPVIATPDIPAGGIFESLNSESYQLGLRGELPATTLKGLMGGHNSLLRSLMTSS